ncbi:uncharacterized protein LODBEIA_P33300 [Lodderomyces beijingensis]|uniref:histidine kinase n=1 Tax=Lodderomyces beijingensis TaxID=1775926 RepID=A0ABP0ZQ99_9ASCO
MRRLRVGIRPQLMVLVGVASLLSLLILGLVTGIYFSNNLKSLRSERLEVISQLKATQLSQAVTFLDITITSMAQVDTIVNPLQEAEGGNTSSLLYSDVHDLFNQYMMTDIVISARLYNKDLEIVESTQNETTPLTPETKEALFPIPEGGPLPPMVSEYANYSFYYTGPTSNLNNDTDTHYYAGATISVMGGRDKEDIIGYLSVILSADTIMHALQTSGSDYWALAVRPVYEGNTLDYNQNVSQTLVAFETVFLNSGGIIKVGVSYNIDESSFISKAFKTNATKGIDTNFKGVSGDRLSASYRRVTFSNWNWLVITAQKASSFNAPVTRIKKIIIGVVIGVGVFMCLLTFTLAVWFIRPITRLQVATMSITSYKREQDNNGPNADGTVADEKLVKRNSVHTTSSNGSGSVYSSGIRLPSRIPRSKMFFKDELTELTDAFNIMTEELEKQYTHLEDRVKLRTRELEASKIEAEAANEAKTVFIANISHELRTPLNGILGMASIAMEEEDQSRMKDSLKLIYRSGELLLHILTELLTYSKNTLNRSKLEKSNFQILEISYQIQSIFMKLANDQRVNFKILVKPNIFRKLILYGDSNRIIQIIMNLVSNSLKFTPVDGSVVVSFKLLGEYDLKRSEEDQYEHVYVMPSAEEPKQVKQLSPVIEFDRASDYFAPKPVAAKPQTNIDELTNFNDYNNNNNNNINDKEIGGASIKDANDDDDDANSITTLSTTQYEKNIFESQFTHKPLSPPPSLSPGQSLERVPTRTSRTPSVTTIHDQTSINRLNLTPNSHEYRSYPKLDKKSDFDSDMANNEVVKNDKTFKIRNMYKPKTWVVQIDVKDTGSGIEPTLQEKVFEPFVQGDQTLSRSYGGTGLGLSICRQLAKMMKGTLTLKSTLGKGSTFTLTLPLPQTGEIVIPPQDLEAFCTDEFNPNAKSNRKVVFDDGPVVVVDENGHAENGEPAVSRNGSTDSSHESDKLSDKSRPSSTSSTASAVGSETASMKLNRSIFADKSQLLQQTSTGTADSVRTGKGSSTATGTAKSSPDEESFSIVREITKIKILIAEDNKVNQEVIKRMLRLEGFTNLTMACNGAEAIDFVKASIENEHSEPFGLIFMDVQMPRIDGLLATKMIRQNLHYKRPIIALTAFADESNVKECYNCGMDGFLSKPIKRSNLKKIFQQFGPHLINDILEAGHLEGDASTRHNAKSSSVVSGAIDEASEVTVGVSLTSNDATVVA